MRLRLPNGWVLAQLPEGGENAPVIGLEYAKHLYQNVFDWYKDAHQRAQWVLTAIGAFLTLLAGAVVRLPAELSKVTATFGPETWAFLALMGGGFLAAGIAAVWALMPLRLRKKTIERDFACYRDSDGSDPAPSVMWYSQFILELGRTEFLGAIPKMDDERERDALASQIFALSRGLRRKYRGVFAAYVGTAIALLMLLATAADYALRV